jgi:DNA glycosylase AlkZ-like
VDGVAHVMLAADVDVLRRQRPNSELRLLPAFDQYVLAASREIEHLVPEEHRPDVFRKINGWIAPTIVLGGRVVGTWSYEKDEVGTDLWEKVPRTRLQEELERVRRVPVAADEDR